MSPQSVLFIDIFIISVSSGINDQMAAVIHIVQI
jgi:hypothetical protein